MENFIDYVSGDEPTLVVFYAAWSNECREVRDVVDEFEESMDNEVRVLKVDVDAAVNASKIDEYEVSSVPTFLFFRSGKVVWRRSGNISIKELKNIFEKI